PLDIGEHGTMNRKHGLVSCSVTYQPQGWNTGMPLYEYICKDCNGKFEYLMRSRDQADEINCRTCSSQNVRRLISSFATAGGFDDQIVASQSTGGGGCCGGSCGCGH